MEVLDKLKRLFSNKETAEEKRANTEHLMTHGWNNAYGYQVDSVDEIRNKIFDRIASDMSMIEFKHTKDGLPVFGSDYVYALNVQANRLQTASDFIFSVVHDLYEKGDVFIEWNAETKEFENLELTRIQFLVDGETIYLRGVTGSNSVVTVLYSQIIHLRLKPKTPFFSAKSNDINKLVEIVSKTNSTMLNELAEGKELQGLLKIPSGLSTERRQLAIADFKKAITSNIGVIDNTNEFVELKNNYSTNTENSKYAIEQIYSYFGVNENILSAKYSKEEYDAYVQTTIAPLCNKLSQAFTGKLLTRYQAKDVIEGDNAGKGKQKLTFELNTFKLAPIEKQSAFLSAFVSSGIGTINEARDLMDLPPVDGGDVVRVSLNYVNAQIADTYQLTNASDKTSATDIDDALKGGEKENEDDDV